MRRASALPPKALLRLAQRETKRYRRRWWTIHLLTFGYVAACVGTLIVSYLNDGPQTDPGTLLLFFVLLPLFVAVSFGERYVPTRAHRSIAQLIEDASDFRFLSIFLSMLKEITWQVGWAPDPVIYLSMRNAFRRLVLEIMEGNPRQIPFKERHQALSFVLEAPYKDVDLTLSVLKALEQIGDESLIPVVEKLAKERPATREAEEIQEAARACLPFLRLHAEDARQAKTLLRAADPSASHDAGDLLLPVTETESILPPEQLLRAADLSGTQVSGTLSNPEAVMESAPVQEHRRNASKEES